MRENLLTLAGRRSYAKTVIEVVASERRLTVSDLLGPDRFSHFVSARREIARRLVAAGLNPYAIAAALKRDRGTVLSYIKRDGWEQKPNFCASRYSMMPQSALSDQPL